MSGVVFGGVPVQKVWMGCQDFHDIAITMKTQTFSILFCGIVLGTVLLSGNEPSASVPAAESAPTMVALFRTSSLVPSLPYAAYQACDRLLSEAIMKHGCRVRGLEESAAALQKCGVAKVEDLSVEQAEGLFRELSGEALIQLTVLSYRIYERLETGRFFRKVSPKKVLVAELSGEIQVWKKGHQRPDVLKFHRTLTSQDPSIAGQENSEMDANGFGQEALRLSLLQALRDFHEKAQ
ncbi:MAG: hypothetical protein MJ202_00725 [Lentisphaeria bacterium]|nr:hypothetical protein [Lentisphaeria bacterium]